VPETATVLLLPTGKHGHIKENADHEVSTESSWLGSITGRALQQFGCRQHRFGKARLRLVRKRLFLIREMSLPMYDPGTENNAPDSVRRMCETIHQADGLIWSNPMYNGTISGSFKNALDWLKLLGNQNPPYLTDKVVGLIWRCELRQDVATTSLVER